MSTFSERLKTALELRNMKQSELVARTGIGKSSISTYLSGEYEPKQKNIFLIARALDVTESWLMGYENVPMERASAMEGGPWAGMGYYGAYRLPEYIKKEDWQYLSEEEKKEQDLHKHFCMLNSDGQDRVLEYAEGLVYSGKYKRNEKDTK